MNIPSWIDITYQENDVEKIDFPKLKMLLKTCASEIDSCDICQPAVQHFDMFHYATPNDKYISFFFSGKNQKFQLNYTKKSINPSLLSTLVKFSNTHKLSLYMSEFCYLTGLNRKESNVFSTNVITLDLDKKELDMQQELSKIQTICDNNGLNLSAVYSSGRGHYLIFKLKEPYVCAKNHVALKRWKYNYDLICDMFVEYGADYKCKDISRVFRLMGSYNYKDDTEYATKILHTWNKENEYLQIPCCKQTNDDNLFDKNSAETMMLKPLPKRKQTPIIDDNETYLSLSENKSFKIQNKKRIKDLLKLLSIRENHLGDRHIYLYILVTQLNVSGYSYKEAYDFLIEKVNPRFSLSESEYEIVRQLQSVYQENKSKKDELSNLEHVENHYHSLTTQWIINTLKITPEEQEKLTVLKDKNTILKQKQARRLEKSRFHNLNKKQQKENEINQLAENFSMETILDKMQLSKSSIYRKLNKTPKQIQTEKENAIILQLKKDGFTNIEIAQRVNLSVGTIKKRLQKINSTNNGFD